MIASLRFVTFAAFLSGCGLIAGLRTDYELSDGGGGGGEAGDARPDGPSCTDMVKNGTEADVDCGGNACPKCGVNKVCRGDSDCLSNNCNNSRCRP